MARIQVLPPWVDAGTRADGAAPPAKPPGALAPAQTGPRAVMPAQLPRAGLTGDIRHADWLFVPVATAPAGDAGAGAAQPPPALPGEGGVPTGDPALPPVSRGAD